MAPTGPPNRYIYQVGVHRLEHLSYPMPPPFFVPVLPFPMTQPPPPPYNPLITPQLPSASTPADRYDSPEVERTIIHLIKLPPGISGRDFRRGSGPAPEFELYKIPTSWSIKKFFEHLGATYKQALQEVVEEGGGHWGLGTYLEGGKNGDTPIGQLAWKRGNGLATASGEPVWICVRKKKS